MVLKIKKRDFIFLSTSLLIAIPLLIAGLMISIPTVLGAVNKSFFIVELTISGRAPKIFYVNYSQAGDLVDSGLAYINFTFNVSDLDGSDDLNSSKTMINTTLGGDGGQSVFNNSNCTITTYNTNYTQYVCTVVFNYYNNQSSSWVVNASVADSSGLSAFNDTLRFTVKELTAMRLVSTAVNFTTNIVAGAIGIGAATNPFIINNTGNFDFTKTNITGQNLTGITDSNQVITSGNITINATDDAVGIRMKENIPVTIPDANLTHGAPGIGNISLYFYTDVPAGLSAQVFNVSKQWEIVLE